MALFKCLRPKVITNPYTGIRQVVGCGKCDACINKRASLWVKRLDMESSLHKYNVFCTLTFSDNDLSQVVRMRSEHWENNVPRYIDSLTGEIFDMSDVHDTFTNKDYEYIKNTKVLDRLEKCDFQKFIKRLRYNFDYCSKGAKLRYFITAEYGPTTYRPHGHLLLFFDDSRCAHNIEQLLSESWPHGVVYDAHFVSGSASKYVASYINGITALPKVYLHKGFRPFHLFSKRPAIGSDYRTIKDINLSFESGKTSFVRLDVTSKQFKAEPFWQSLETKLYPRYQRFGCLSREDRVGLIREMSSFPLDKPASVIADRLKRYYIDDKNKDTFVSRYLREICFKTVTRYHFLSDKVSPFVGLPWLPKDIIVSQDFKAIPVRTKEFNYNSLLRFSRTLHRMYNTSLEFGVSLVDFQNKISDYYDRKEQESRSLDYSFQSDYFLHYPKWHFLYFDLDFCKKVTTCDFETLSVSYQNYLNYLFDYSIPFKVLDNGSKVVDIPPFYSLPVFHSFSMLYKKITFDLTKQKKNNDYALAQKDKFFNVITYQNN